MPETVPLGVAVGLVHEPHAEEPGEAAFCCGPGGEHQACRVSDRPGLPAGSW